MVGAVATADPALSHGFPTNRCYYTGVSDV